MQSPVNIFWFRRDLRLHDNAGLYHALKDGKPVLPIFIFDTDILDELEDKADRRVDFIHQALEAMQKQLIKMGSTLEVMKGKPIDIFRQLLKDYEVAAVFTNHDYEPYARSRDAEIASFLKKAGITFQTFKDQVIFEKDEIMKPDGKPYSVFTPYSIKWKSALTDFYIKSYPTRKYQKHYLKQKPKPLPKLDDIGFKKTDIESITPVVDESLIRKYNTLRDKPAAEGTSRLSVHLRFGTISIRELVSQIKPLNDTFLNELIWREFYQMILWHFPKVVSQAFKPAYDSIKWRNNEKEFDAWCQGKTGYPIVDAGMRELNETGFMHNRVRMVVASFLTKHLLIDWRWGEAYFAKKLLDFELASNNGGWQWAAGSGCDAAPYFRIFNPYLQTKKFDPAYRYIKKWVPEFQSSQYPPPIVEHEFARKRALEVYASALKS